MADNDDPWANHIRGTPLAEGSDPLSMKEEQVEDSAIPQDDTITHDVNELELSSAQRDSPEATAPVATTSDKRSETGEDDEDDEENFVYPNVVPTAQNSHGQLDGNENPPPPTEEHDPIQAQHGPQDDETSTAAEAQPVDHARLTHLCSQGPLSSLQSFFNVTTSAPPAGSGVSAFALANEPNPVSGLLPIHYAAREGRLEIVKWLIRDAGALVEMEDREGETALHKAAMAGKLPVLTFLISAGASADCADGDGWTPLHNACSKGFLDIVKVLVEAARASVDGKGGRGGWTPLMNAASNGHLPIVRYLTSKQSVDPFVRNAAGETAYDVAAATFEIFICEILSRYESEKWASLRFASNPERIVEVQEQGHGRQLKLGEGPYNPLALHSVVPVILHENQRLDTRLSTLAIRGGKPRWSGTQAGRPDKSDRRAPGTMPPGPLSLSRTRNVPMAREDVKVPTRQHPYKLRLSNRATQIASAKRARGELVSGEEEYGATPTRESVLQASRDARPDSSASVSDAQLSEASHFWLSEWQTDLTHPQVDAEDGWQYCQSFDSPEERWLASAPPPLVRLLEGRGLGSSVQRAVSSVVLAASSGAAPVAETEAISSGWVRRRRWVRVMRRRLDIDFHDGLEATERSSLAKTVLGDTALDEHTQSSLLEEAHSIAIQEASGLGPNADYLARSRALAGNEATERSANSSQRDMQIRIGRLELGVLELRQNAFSDTNADRQRAAEELLKDLTLQIGQLRQAAGLDEESEDEDSDEEFIYPNSYKDGGQSVITRVAGPFTTSSGVVPTRPSIVNRQSSTPSVFGEHAASGEAGTSLGALRSADLANAREFRVPTHEVPSRPAQPSRPGSGPALLEHNLLPTWESDAAASDCRGCNRKFTFFLRKHHCRRCGRIFCDACSSHRVHLTSDELVIDPGIPEMMMLESLGPTRICDGCDAERRLPVNLRNTRNAEALSTSLNRLDLDHDTSAATRRLSDASSRASELTECPVCGQSLDAFDQSCEQEEHVRTCLENGGGGSVQGGQYLVYKLSEGPIVGKECQICLEDLLVGMTIARLPCLCYYHRHCIDSWFSRGRNCPVHARVW